MALVVLAGTLLSLLFYRYIIYPAFFSPLARIPNAHFTSPFSNAWIQWQRYQSRGNRAIHEAHQQLGPIVRLGATEISVNSIDCVRTVYGDAFDRHEWYSRAFDNYGVPNMFSMVSRRPHMERKRILASLYSKSSLHASPDILKILEVLVERLLRAIEIAAEKRDPLDALEFSLAVSMDFVTAYLFGLRDGSDFLHDAKTRNQWLHAHHYTKGQGFLSLEFPRMASFLALFGIGLPDPKVVTSTKLVKDLCLQMMEKVESASMDESTQSSKPVVYERLLQQLSPSVDNSSSLPSLNPTQLRLTIASELMDHIMAGTETTGWTLTYIMYQLSLHPDLQSRLRFELMSLPSPMLYPQTQSYAKSTPPSPRTIDDLPLLDAIILETLRRYPAVPGPKPRISRVPTSLGCYTGILPGIRVSAQAYSLHRNTDVFPDPEAWIPMRWLDANKETRDKMMRWFWAFGSGGRMCIGNHFAMLGQRTAMLKSIS